MTSSGADRLVNTVEDEEQSLGLAARARRWLRRIRPDRARRQLAHALYRNLVKQARMPVFYRGFGVPDTPEGRFEMVGLHVALVVRRLTAEAKAGRVLAQELFDLMFEDMDESLRQIGIGDLSVGRQMKRLAGNFYARLSALDQALSSEPSGPLEPILRTNLYHGGVAPTERQLARLVDYVVAADRALRAQSRADLLAGRLCLVRPEEPGAPRPRPRDDTAS
jgi:cytochrome b pre-mRNA-processing protein 3